MASSLNTKADLVDDAEDEEIFEDAEDTVRTEGMDLSMSICDAQTALNLFLNNKFEEAIRRMAPWSESSMYHSLAHTTLLYMQAMLSFEKPDIDAAIVSTKKSINLASSLRKKHSMMQSLKQISQKIDYSLYTDVEVHAELVFAECLLLRAMLSFVQDENLMSFIKGALKIKTCYQSYKECQKMVECRNKSNLIGYEHFVSGVRMGIGTFNLMISQLPNRVLKLLEFVGFSGNRGVGLRELRLGSDNLKSLRGPLCSLILLTYNTLITYILGTGEGDIDACSVIIKPCIEAYPESALFLFFNGRIEQIKGNIDVGISRFLDSVDSQAEWKQFHHICYWELMWCYAYQCDWLLAMKYAERLAEENKWSKATYTYLKASFLALCDGEESTRKTVDDLYSQVPNLIQRFAGKSLPIEKFALKKVKLYKAQNNQLNLAALEMIYVWNGFAIIGRDTKLLDPISQLIENTINELLQRKDKLQYYYDNYSLALLLKGVCLGIRGQRFQADMCFQEIIAHQKELKFDTYLVPWAVVERALLHIDMNELKDAENLLESAKNNFKGYALESRLHFKIHAADKQIQAKKAKLAGAKAEGGCNGGSA
ncbi:tetratricopeptide repeat protein 39B-like [Watersipora subatra]|uniref:tetratricopeptide repeat protein 39B-like n=1 Tax=Watersipora subatra TaxID=2589382 RepID=UPI00355B7BBB